MLSRSRKRFVLVTAAVLVLTLPGCNIAESAPQGAWQALSARAVEALAAAMH